MEPSGIWNKFERIFSSVRDIAIIVFVAVLTWRLTTTLINIDFSDIQISDFLSIILAIFAIGLSAAFYFKANEVGNRFYDNMYKFTKDTSEILGRIEAGFGERLRHLDESYIGLRAKFDQVPTDRAETKKEIAKEEEQVKIKEDERTTVFEELARRAQLQEHEKLTMLSRLRKSEEELIKARSELEILRRRLAMQEEEVEEDTDNTVDKRTLFNYTQQIVRKNFPRNLLGISSEGDITRRFNIIKNKLPGKYLEDLAYFGYLDSEGKLSNEGIELFTRAVKYS